MIIIEVHVPVLQAVYEFSVDEARPIRDIVLEIRQVIAKKQHEKEPDAYFEIHSTAQECVLPLDKSLFECGVRNGTKLILV